MNFTLADLFYLLGSIAFALFSLVTLGADMSIF